YCAFEGNIKNVTVTAEVASDYIVSATEVASAVTVTATATDDEIMAKAPAESDVTVTLLCGETANAKAVWTGVERQGSDVYLMGNILAAGTSNLNGVKVRMPVTIENIEETAAMLSYAFDNAVNPGASDKGGVFDLTIKSGNVAVSGGYAQCENAVLSAKTDASGYDFMDYMNDFTIAVKFKLPIGIAQTHIPVVTVYGNGSEKQNSSVITANAYEAGSASTTLRMGFAYHSTDSSDGGGEDGFANAAYWSKYNAAISLGVWNTLAFSYRASDRMFTAYLNGNAVCAYEVAEEAVFAGKQCFTLGTTDGTVLYRALKIYDYVPSSENLAVLSDACVMPKGAETQAAANKVICATAASLAVETAELSGSSALKAVQKANKTVRAKLGDGEEKVNVFWDTAAALEDGSYKVTGLIFGAYNPDGVRAETIVSVKEYDITFTATNAAVKSNGTSVEKMSVKYGADAQFTVEPGEGYTIKRVKAGDVELTAVNGVYTVACITEELSVTVETERGVTDAENKNGENGEAAEEKKGCGSGCGS
ncbi:MAG: hypothetical protein ACI4RO_05950, partial [Candidatus Scatosoma sp.]